MNEAKRLDVGLKGGGPYKVITDKAVLEFDGDQKKFKISSIHPQANLEEVTDAISFGIEVSHPMAVTSEPTLQELKILREVIDPNQIILKE